MAGPFRPSAPVPGVPLAPLRPRPAVGPVTKALSPTPERAGAAILPVPAIPQRFLPASQDVAVTAYALPKPAVGVLGGGGSLSDYNDGNDKSGRDRTGLLDPSRVSLVSPIHAAVLAMSSGQQQKTAASKASRELTEALAAARAYRDSWYSGSRTSSIFDRTTSPSSEPDDQPTSALLQLASAALAGRDAEPGKAADGSCRATRVGGGERETEKRPVAVKPPPSLGGVQSCKAGGLDAGESTSREIKTVGGLPTSESDSVPSTAGGTEVAERSEVAVASDGEQALAPAEVKPPLPTATALTRRAGQMKRRSTKASTLPRSFVLEQTAADVGLVLGPPAAAAATAPAALPNVADLAKLTADLGIEPDSPGLTAAVVPTPQPAARGSGERPLLGGPARRTPTLSKAADLARLAADLGVDVAATLPKNVDLVRLAASFGSQPAVTALLAQGADLFGPRRGGLGVAATLPKNMDLGRLAADLGIDVASSSSPATAAIVPPGRASAESWRERGRSASASSGADGGLLLRGRSAAPAQGRAAAVSSAAIGATAQLSDRGPGRIAACTSSLTAPAPALTGRKAGGRGGDGNGAGGGVVQETHGLLAAAAAVAARRRPSAASRAGDATCSTLGSGRCTSTAPRLAFTMPMSSSSADAAAAVAVRTSIDLKPATCAITVLKSDTFGSPRSGLPIVAPLALHPGVALTGMLLPQQLQVWEASEVVARRLEQLPVPDMELWLQNW
ncbi:hypothetical protein HK405_005933 [Cladochytrium tenue]|nr:hypothetical protein HK405_005933 [Cladochytrium tenue]